MDEAATSLMMKFDTTGGPVAAECPLLIDSKDTLANQSTAVRLVDSMVTVPKFRMANGGSGQPGYFLISSFSFACSLSDEEGKTSGGSVKSRASALAARLGASPPPKLPTAADKAALDKAAKDKAALAKAAQDAKDKADQDKPPAPSFSKWRSMTKSVEDQQPKNQPANTSGQLYNSQIDSFTFTRLIDCATSTLLTACCESKSFKSASLIKRKPAVLAVKTDPVDIAFIRVDFADVKITSLKFADGDVVSETCTFTSSAIQITYAVQSASGALSLLPPVSWQAAMADTSYRQYI
jgi:type VI protein secretion system component Hcp